MRKNIIGISFPISTDSLQNVNMNDEHSSNTNKLSNSDLGAAAPEESLKGVLFQLRLRPHSPRACSQV